MKKIEAFIKPFKVDDVVEALSEIGIEGRLSLKSKALADKKVALKSIKAQNMLSISCRKLN